MSNTTTFGQQLNQLNDIQSAVRLEKEHNKHASFEKIDAIIGKILKAVFESKELLLSESDPPDISIFTKAEKQLIQESFGFEQQQKRGVWYIPEYTGIKLGHLILPYSFKHYGRFGTGIAKEHNQKYSLKDKPEYILFWSILEPLLTTLFIPFEIRGLQSGKKALKAQLKDWNEFDQLLNVLEIQFPEKAQKMRPREDWHLLSSNEQLKHKQELLEGLANQIQLNIGTYYRVYRIQELTEKYYKKAKKEGSTLKKQVLTKVFERDLSGFFGGNWLAFLEYLDETPHQEEEIISTLPEVKIAVGGSEKAQKIAKEHNIPVEEANKILASYWQQPVNESPIEKRVTLLKRFWKEFQSIHDKQTSKMKSLWGLEGGRSLTGSHLDHYDQELYKSLISKDIVDDTKQLWGTKVLSRWPEKMVTEVFPYESMIDTLGIIFKFWHGCYLTAWFICEGPFSRTDLPGLQDYFHKVLKAFEEMNTPIDRSLFKKLIEAEKYLGPPQSIEVSSSTSSIGNGMSLTTTTYSGERRDGFEKLRDIITFYCHSWSDTYLERYLESLWKNELTEVGQAYNLQVNKKGKPPTAKQFSKFGSKTANNWFGGNINDLYGAIREKSPIHPTYTRLMPEDYLRFAQTLKTELVKQFSDNQKKSDTSESDYAHHLDYFVRNSLLFVELEEAIGKSPKMSEFGSSKVKTYSQTLNATPEEIWEKYSQAIHNTLSAIKY